MVEIVPYKKNWPNEFKDFARAIRNALGDSAIRIDHIGSTSVPGLDAKDVIDIQVSVKALSSHLIEEFTAMGFVYRGDRTDHVPPGTPKGEDQWQKMLFEQPDGQRRVHVHVRILGNANQRYPLLFRDYLRSHPASAAAYAELKRRLAANLVDPDTYPDVKDPAVDLIFFAAEDWATSTNWSPGPSDA
jgi:GrpB-like predicted nucleotidyltransferase (UPF0157 family)